MGCVCGSSRVTNRSNMPWVGHSTRSGATKLPGGTGNSSVAPSHFAGIMPLTQRLAPPKRLQSRLSQKLLSKPVLLLMQRERGKKISEGKSIRPQVGAIGAAGHRCPHLLPYNCSFIGLSSGMLSLSTALLDTRPQSAGNVNVEPVVIWPHHTYRRKTSSIRGQHWPVTHSPCRCARGFVR